MYPNTQLLIEGLVMDTFPVNPVCVDFGIRNMGVSPAEETKRFGALQFAFKKELVTKTELDAALGDGLALTEIVNRGKNPYACTITTAWDNMPDEEEEF